MRGNEKLYFNDIQVEPCTYYKYLRIMFSSSLKWSIPLQTIASNKAILVVRNIQRLCGCVPVDVCFKLIDKIIAPICYMDRKSGVMSLDKTLRMNM